MSNIEVKDLSVNYNGVKAIQDIDFTIQDRDFLAIIGPNGGGKTTLIKVLLELIKADKGSVVKDKKSPMGYVPQFTFFDKTFPIKVFDVILSGRLPKKIKLFQRYTSKDKKEVEKVMESLEMLHLKERQIGQLSGGQIQKVLIARALITNPKILILDEPTASLDLKTKTEIYSILKELNREKTIIMVTHDIEEVFPYIKSILYINRKLKFYGKKEFYNSKVIKNDRIIV